MIRASRRREIVEVVLIILATLVPALLWPAIKGLAALVPLLYLLVERQLRRRPWSELGVTRTNFGEALAATWPLILLVGVVLQPLVTLAAARWMPGLLAHVESRVPLMDIGQLVPFIGLLLVGTLIEELTYRGLFQARLGQALAPPAAIAVVSVVFALMHLTAGPLPIVLLDLSLVLLDSVVYGFIFARGNNLWLAWLAHFLADLSAVIALRLL